MGQEEKTDEQIDESLIEQISYEGDQSPEFDALVRTREHTTAPQDGLSEPTRDKVLVSGWHVPCHCIVVRTKDGLCQAFHVQPNKGGSFLTADQEDALKGLGQQKASAIVAKGQRSWFGFADIQELAHLQITLERVVNVDTSNRWRLLYDPQSNELWIDSRDEHLLTKYRGFSSKASQGTAGLTRRTQQVAA